MIQAIVSTRRRRLVLGALIVVGAPIIAIGWWLGSPLFINVTVDEEFPFAAVADLPAGVTMAEADMAMEVTSRLPDAVMAEDMTPAMAVVRVLSTGEFRDADRFHTGSGSATIYVPDDGTPILRLEEFRVTNGPRLHVLLSTHPDPMNGSELKDDGYIDLGALKGNVGNQNYQLPANADPASFRSVVIYCTPFHVIFAVAPLDQTG